MERPRSAAEAVFEPVQPLTTFEETVERLGTGIRLGLLQPGTRLPPERELADQLGISRSTLRQAITTLVQSGHLTSVRGRGGGTFVVEEPPLGKEVDRLRDDWREVLDMRVTVEVGAAMLAAERATKPAVARLSELVDEMDDPPDFETYRRGDIGFHIAVAEATGAPRVVSAMTEVQGQVSDLITHIANPPEVLSHSNEEHRQLVAAIARHDAPRAALIMRAHLEGTEHIVAGLRRG